MICFILVIYLIWDHLGSHMLQRNSGAPCYYVCLSPLPLVMRTGSQRRNNLSEDLFTGSRPHYILEKMQENWLVLLTFVDRAFDPKFRLLTRELFKSLEVLKLLLYSVNWLPLNVVKYLTSFVIIVSTNKIRLANCH